MHYAYRFRLKPTTDQRALLDKTRDICRQLYNHALKEFNTIPESEGTLNQRVRQVRDQIPDLREWWDEINQVYSTVLQAAVMRIEDSIKALSELKKRGYNVGSLNWQAPKDFRSFTYVQSGFEFDRKNGQTVLSLSKLADVPIIIHREIPDDVTVKEVTIKKERTGEWYACFAVERMDTPEKPTDPERCVGIDVGILKYTHDTDGVAVKPPNLSTERNRLRREQRKLSRKQHGSNNWEQQRQRVAECHQQLKRKRHDFLHKLSNYYATEYDLVVVEDLDVRNMLESPRNSRNTASAAWDTFTGMLEYKCEREGTHFVAVESKDTTKECASCGVKTDKPLWVREHSCPACGFEMDRDANAAINILVRGFEQIGVGHAESTPVKTVLPLFTSSGSSGEVDGKHVIESGSPCLKEPPKVASRQG